VVKEGEKKEKEKGGKKEKGKDFRSRLTNPAAGTRERERKKKKEEKGKEEFWTPLPPLKSLLLVPNSAFEQSVAC